MLIFRGRTCHFNQKKSFGGGVSKPTPFPHPKKKRLLCSQFFPTCQVRVVRFYVSLSFSSSFSSSSFSSSSSSSPPLLLSCAGPQRRSCVCSVPRRTSTAILCVQCSAPDLNCDPVSAVFRAGPQPRSCECRVPRRTSTAIL